MARFIYQGFTQDANGKIITGATVTVYLAGTTTPAVIYAADSGGSAIAGGALTSDADTGQFKFYADDNNYRATSQFDLVLSKTNYTTTTLEDVVVPGLPDVYPGITELNVLEVMSDDETYDLPITYNGGWGWVYLGNGGEFAIFTCDSAAAVTLIANSTNVVTSDSDNNLCIYDSGTVVRIKNRLNGAKNMMLKFHYQG